MPAPITSRKPALHVPNERELSEIRARLEQWAISHSDSNVPNPYSRFGFEDTNLLNSDRLAIYNWVFIEDRESDTADMAAVAELNTWDPDVVARRLRDVL